MRERERCFLNMYQYIPGFPIPISSSSVLPKNVAGEAVKPCHHTGGGTNAMSVKMQCQYRCNATP